MGRGRGQEEGARPQPSAFNGEGAWPRGCGAWPRQSAMNGAGAWPRPGSLNEEGAWPRPSSQWGLNRKWACPQHVRLPARAPGTTSARRGPDGRDRPVRDAGAGGAAGHAGH